MSWDASDAVGVAMPRGEERECAGLGTYEEFGAAACIDVAGQ